MHCRRCGAVVTGKYCSCCGFRVRSDVDEYKALLRLAKKDYMRECRLYESPDRRGLAVTHLAEACWMAADMRYGSVTCTATFIMSQVDVNNIETVREHAMLLFRQLIAF